MTAPRVHLRHQHEIREQGRASPRSFLSLRRPFSLDQGDRLLMGRAGVEGQIRAFWILLHGPALRVLLRTNPFSI